MWAVVVLINYVQQLNQNSKYQNIFVLALVCKYSCPGNVNEIKTEEKNKCVCFSLFMTKLQRDNALLSYKNH